MTESLHRTTGQPVADDPGLPRVTPLVKSLEPDLVAFRRDLHRDPELSYEEHRTTRRVLELLTDHGLNPVKLQDTGAYVDIGEGPLVLGLRADIDALPLPERTGLDYASATEGVAHACGHDVHTSVMACLLYTSPSPRD